MAREEHAKRIVLGDTSALIALAAAGGFGLFRRLFGTFYVTSAVHDEVLAGGNRPGVSELGEAVSAGWLRIIDNIPDEPLLPNLGEGEASSLRAALAAGSDSLVILDDRVACEIATHLHVAHVGTLGLLLEAKRRGLLDEVRPCLEALVANGFFIRESLLSVLIRDAGEE